MNANIYIFWKKDKRDGVSKAAYKEMLKFVTEKMKKNVKITQIQKVTNKEQQRHQQQTKTTKSTLQDRPGGTIGGPRGH